MSGWTIDVKQLGDALIYFAAVSGAGFALWKMWFKSIVEWVKAQGETNNTVARVITEELPKMTRAIERVTDTQRDHGKRIEDLDHRVASIEGGANGLPSPAALMNQPRQPRKRGGA